MAWPECMFVDQVGRDGARRLNLNDGGKVRLLTGPEHEGPDFTPPPLKRAVSNTLLVEGAKVHASAYDNRVIRLPLRLTGCTAGEQAEFLQDLHRELDREQNVLKWQPVPNRKPIYFRTLRSPDYGLNQRWEGRGELRLDVGLLAEPFGYGDYIEQTGTIYNDPAAVANGLYFEIDATTGEAAEGDVATPLLLYFPNAPAVGAGTVLAVRRHGTPALYYEQCENMTPGVDATTPGNDPAMSGGGNNWVNISFATATWQTRVTWDPCPAAGNSVEYRGRYRVFLRVQRSDNTSDIEMRIRWAFAVIENDAVVVPQNTNIQLLDLGIVSIPGSPDPVNLGYSNEVLPAQEIPIYFQATRTAGAGTIGLDYAVLVPADEELMITDSASLVVIDGPNDIEYWGDMTYVRDANPLPLVGSIPLVSPNQTNLYVVLLGIATNSIATAKPYTARWWPRYLYASRA